MGLLRWWIGSAGKGENGIYLEQRSFETDKGGWSLKGTKKDKDGDVWGVRPRRDKVSID